MRFWIIIPLVACLVLGCEDDSYFGPVYSTSSDTVVSTKAQRLFVGCEGNFQFGNASLSVIDLDGQTIQNGAYERVHEAGIGDVLQSLYLHGDSLFVVVNNSGVIRILDRESLQEINTIQGLTSPRNIHVLNDEYMVVTDLYSDYVTIYRLSDLSLVKSLPTDGWTERMTQTGSALVIGNMDTRALEVMEATALEWERHLSLSMQPAFCFSTEQDVWIVGNRSEDAQLAVVKRMNSDDWSVTDSLLFDASVSGAAMGPDHIYVLLPKQVVQLDAYTLQETGRFSHEARTPYALAIDPSGTSLFIADAADYLSAGHVVQYTVNGVHQKTYTTGLIPQAFCFDTSSDP